jgi:hypothetical protein
VITTLTLPRDACNVATVSDDKTPKKKSHPSQPLCLCGKRGCSKQDEHTLMMVRSSKRGWLRKKK